MGTPEGCPDGEEIDCSAGKIVWVRRRNGSWWPGRIIGIDELSASHLMSPRSGTPVKLLGREDASVDWYNLEKSKRVKGFRCGEFNDCIERAEAAQGNPLKKREKYARREDAILHALELEKEQLHRNRLKLGISSKHLGVNSGLSENYYEKDEIADTHESGTLQTIPLSWKSGAPFDNEDMANPLYSRKEKHMRLSRHEDGNSEMFQRMRGLQDFGLRTASSKRKLPAPVSLADCDNIALPNHVGSSKNPLTVKRKRSHNGPTEEPFVKRRDRRRPLVQVLQSSAKLHSFDPLTSHHDDASMSMYGERVGAVFRAKRSKCVYFPADDYMNRLEYPPHEMQASGLLDTNNTFFRSSEDEESDSSEEDCCDENMEEATTAYSDSAQVLAVREPSNSNNSAGKGQMLELEDFDESTLSSYGSHPHMYEQNSGISTDVAGSKWQLKGKRNIRNAFKRPSEVMDTNHSSAGEKCNGSNQLEIYDSKKNTLMKRTSQRALGGGGSYGRRDDPIYDYYFDDDDEDDDDDDDEDDDDDDDDDDDHDGEGSMENDLIDGSLIGYESKRYPFMSRTHSVQETSDDDTTDLDDDSERGLRGYWGESDECFNPYYVGHFGNSLNMLLLDVDLKVQVSYKREQVPLVSLMSRLNGKAIIGHPLQVEKLEDGTSQLLFPGNDNGEGLLPYDDDDGNSGLQPVWRTARRTVMHRVPRSQPSSAFDVDETDLVQYSDIERRSKSYVNPFNNKGRPVKKNSSRPQAHSEKKNSKKQSKKVSLSNQKTRTLSSIATEQRFCDHIPAVKLERPLKLEGVTPIACVPVKMIFSRIKEAVGKVPSLPERKLS